MSDLKYDLAVIGGGPAGYAAAIRAGQLGKRVICIEAERAGGTCLNWGCIPSKALLKSAELFKNIQESDTFGIQTENVSYDFSKVIGRSRGVADQMGKGIEFLFKKNRVDYVRGRGRLMAPEMIEITEGEKQGELIMAENILLATGCKARTLPDLPVDGTRIMTSREALAMQEQPESIVILGAGAIGCEFAYFLNAFGTRVTLVEMLPRILPQEDEETSQALEKSFKRQGINVHTGVKAENIRLSDNGVVLDLVNGENTETIESASLLLAIGLTANSEGLVSDRMPLTMDRGYITVNERYETSLSKVYAAGDIIGPPWLAHVATYEALQAVNGMFGVSEPKRVERFPSCTYCQPQVASIGLSEAAAKEQGIAYKVGKFPFTASGKAVASAHADGFVKVIVNESHGEIIGAHIVGSDATELITEYALAMELEATHEDIHHTIHAHPTLSEALAEAAADVEKEAIHI